MGDNFQALGLDAWDGNTQQLEGYRTATGITFPLLEKAGSVATSYGTRYDRGVVVDQDGNIAYKGTGLVINDLGSQITVIDNLLNPTAIDLDEPDLNKFELSQNFPNPFNPNTTIAFTLPAAQSVSIKIYDMQGRFVRQILNSEMAAGLHELNWNGIDQNGEAVASGTYIYILQSADFKDVKKMTS